MNRELFDRVWRSMRLQLPLPARPSVSRVSPAPPKDTRSGTTILAFRYKDGIFMAADRKRTSGDLISSQSVIKISQVDDMTAILGAGVVADLQFISRQLSSQNEHYKARFGFPISIEGKAQFMVNLAREWYYAVYPDGLLFQIILAGRNPEGDYHIYEVAYNGYLDESSYKYGGSGEEGPRNILIEKRLEIRNTTLSLEESCELSAKAIYRSGMLDTNSSDVRVSYPSFATLTSSGFAFIDDATVKNVCDAIIKDEVRRDG